MHEKVGDFKWSFTPHPRCRSDSPPLQGGQMNLMVQRGVKGSKLTAWQ